MIKEAIQAGDPRLKALNKTIEDFNDPIVRGVVEDLIDSMKAANLVGMAAPQIGENWRIFVTEPRKTKFRDADQTDELRIYINPKITNVSKRQVIIWEGCGSFAHGQIFGPVRRPAEITVESFDLSGRQFRLVCNGLLARVIQHEQDHLDGIEFTEKMFDLRQFKDGFFYIRDIKGTSEQTKASRITKKEFQWL